MDKSIYLIELFAGIGSQAKALKNIGINVIHHKVIEKDKFAIASYNALHNTNFKPIDIIQITGNDLDITNTNSYTYLLTYSFPCQDLSIGGKRAGMSKGYSTRSGLLWEVERLLNECKELPQYLLLENVPQIHSKKNIQDFLLWQKFLEEKGYINYWQDLNAKDYGIPQNRNRTFMISIRNDINHHFIFPTPFYLHLRLKDMLEEKPNINLCNLSPKTICLNSKGGRSGIPNLQPSLTDRIYSIYGISTCITTSTFYMPKYLLNNKLHVLSPKECWLLMGFTDDDFENAAKVNTDLQLYKQAGNSIVVNVLESIFKQLFFNKLQKKL